MTLISDLLDLPQQVSRGDFVLNLAAGVSQSNVAGTLRTYVVTPQLTACFDQALGFIKGAIDAAASKACYLHGSFGSPALMETLISASSMLQRERTALKVTWPHAGTRHSAGP